MGKDGEISREKGYRIGIRFRIYEEIFSLFIVGFGSEVVIFLLRSFLRGKFYLGK